MAAKLCPKVILEGTRLTHKTDIAFALNEHPQFVGPRKYRYHSPIVSAEWCGFTPHPWGRGLINFDTDELPRAIETYKTWMRLFELLCFYSWIVDRFHLSTIDYQLRHHDTAMNFAWLEQRLLAVGFRLVICTRDPATFASARPERVKISGKPSQYDDLDGFVSEQESFLRLAQKSRLPRLVVDVSDDDVPAACDRIVDWLDSTGGLYMPDVALE